MENPNRLVRVLGGYSRDGRFVCVKTVTVQEKDIANMFRRDSVMAGMEKIRLQNV